MARFLPRRLTSSVCPISEQVLQNPIPFDAIPGPSGRYRLPYIGHVFHFKPFGDHLSSTLTDLLRYFRRQYGPVVRQRMGAQWLVFLFDPADIQQLLFQYEKYPLRPTPHLMCAYARRNNTPLSMAFQNNQEWIEARRPVQELILKPAAVSKYFREVVDITEEFLKHRAKGSRHFEDTQMELTRLTMENSGMFCLNRRLGILTKDNPELLAGVQGVHSLLGQSFDCLPVYSLFPTKFYRDFEKVYTTVRLATRESLAQISEAMTLKPGEPCLKDLTFTQQLMLDSRMSRDLVESTVTDMFIAGADVTANVLSFILFHLAKNPNVQKTLFEEINQRCKNNQMNESTFANMPYLKACIKESLRLVPPLRDGVRRQVEMDTVVAGYHIPKGTTLVFCNSVISSDENFFPDPLAYRPERWMRGSPLRRTIHPFAVLPFGFGRRNCIGQRFAELQMHIFIVKLLQRYSVSLESSDEKLPFHYTIFATPSRKFSVLLQKRKNRNV
ncbi:putative cytochrome P450 49a1 [Crassostrea virginica]